MFGIFNKKSGVVKEERQPSKITDNQPKKVRVIEDRKPQPKLAPQDAAGRVLRGVVVSDKMQKTVVVAITRTRIHSKYRKGFKLTTRFKAHDENNEYHVGDAVIIQETRPVSKEKRWRVIGKA